MATGNEEVVRAALEAWNENDWARMEGLTAAETSISAPEGWPESGTFHGWEAVKRQFERLKEAWSEEHIEPLEIETAGPRTLVRVRWMAKGGGSGLDLDLEMWAVYSIVDGKITHISFNLDEGAARAELGR